MDLRSIKERLIFWMIRLITLDYYVVKKEIKKTYKKKGKILDLGSGSGYLAPLFDKKSYLGIEIDPVLVAFAKKDYPGYSFKVGDMTKINLGEKYDFVLVIGVLHHLDGGDFTKALNVIHNHLKIKGKVLIIEAIPPLSGFNILGRIIRFLDRGDNVRSLRLYKTMLSKKLSIYKAKPLRGGVIDYALFILGRKKN